MLETAEVLAPLLVKLLVELVGHEKAQAMVSEEARTRANAIADAVVAARKLAEG